MPGEKQVGSVSIRVVPDVTGFKEKVRAELAKIGDIKIPVTLDLDKGLLTAELNKLRSEDIKIPAQVDLDQDQIGKVLAEKPIHIPAEVDIDQDALGRAIAGRKIHVPAQIDLDRDPFREMLRGIVTDVGGAFTKVGAIGSSAFSAVGQAGDTAFRNVASSFDGLSEGFSKATSSAQTLATALVVVPGIATGVIVAGAGITAAYGAAATAVAAVPAAISLIAAPIAAVTLGIKGIQAAAKTLQPTFDALKKSVSDTFQKGLTPVFAQLKSSLAALTPSVNLVANAVVSLGQQVADFVTKGQGLQQIQTVFANVAAAIKTINLTPLLDGLTSLAGQRAAMDALVTTVNGLGKALQSISKNADLTAAFKGLGGILDSLTTSFSELVNNGITLFANAAPGVKATVDAINGLFSKFDYKALGTSVSQVFEGIAGSINKISPQTVAAIQKGFQDLGATFNDPGFQQGLANFASLIPRVLEPLNDLAKVFAFVGKAIGENPLGPPIKRNLDGAQAAAQQGTVGLSPILKKGFEPFTEPTKYIPGNAFGPPIKVATSNAVTAVTTGLQPVPQVTGDKLRGIIPAARDAVSPLGSVIGQSLEQLPGLFADKANAARLGFGTGLKNLPADAAQQLGLVTPAVTTGLTPAQEAASTAATALTQGFVTALAPLGTAFTTITPQITAFGTALTAMNPQLLAFGTSFTTLNPQILAFGTTLTTLNPQLLALGTAFTTLNPQLLAFGTTLTTLNPQLLALGTSMTTLNPQLLALGTAFTTLNPQLLAFGTTLTTLNPQMLALGTSLTTLNPQILALGTAFTTLNPQILAFGTSLTTVVASLTAFGAALTTAAASATAFGAAVTTAFTTASAAITTGIQQAVQAVTQGFAQMVQAATQGGTQIVQAGTTMMTNFVKAVTDGMTNAVKAATDGLAKIKAAIPPDALVSVGRALIEGMAKGMVAGIPAVEAAARQAVQKAVAAAQSEANTGSPSKLFRDQVGRFLTLGQAVGQLAEIGAVEDASRASVQAALAAARYEIDHAPDLAQAFLDQTGLADFNAQMDAAFSSGSFNPPSGSGGDIVLNIPVQVGNEPIEHIVKRLSDADKQDLLMKLRAG